MIRIFIDNQEVVSSEDTSLEYIRENPFFNKTGDYSYDIDIDLHIEKNAKLYKFMHRPNSARKFSNRVAEIYDGPRLLCRGIEVILSIEESIAKIQIIANNSEFNHILNEKTKIRTLNWGSLRNINKATAAANVNKKYPQVDVAFPVCTSVYEEPEDSISPQTDNLFNMVNGSGGIQFEYISNDNLRPMPFFLYYVDKLVELLGYTIGTDDIDRDKYNSLIITSGINSMNFADYLPNWTVSEFITEIEKFFGVIFYFDSITKTVDILAMKKFYGQIGKVVISDEDILEEHDEEYLDEDDEGDTCITQYVNVGYKHNGDIWNIADIDIDLYEQCEIAERNNYWSPVVPTNPGEKIIYKASDWNQEYMAFNVQNGSYVNGYANRMVNQFKTVYGDREKSLTELKIIPAYLYGVWTETQNEVDQLYHIICPMISDETQEEQTFTQIVTEGEKDNSFDVMQVALYIGLINTRDTDGGKNSFSVAPVCVTCWANMTENYNTWFHYDKTDIPAALYNDASDWTLALHGAHGRVARELDNDVGMDTKTIYTFRFATKKMLDPRAKFIIHSRLFYCRRLKYSVENCRMSEICEGEFHPAS